MDLSLQNLPRFLNLLHSLSSLDLRRTGNQIVHLRVIHQFLEFIFIQLEHNAFRADDLRILHTLSFENDLLLTEVTLLTDCFSIYNERGRQRLCFKLIFALLDD